ncbi:MAG: helix-turn-helix domain-containing protein [Lachnospiraceae bacterium]|nr:helix-turn-helix domain-containing protein [Lachnospiraceae bacterium]
MYKKFILKDKDGRNNLCGKRIREYRLSQPSKLSQRELAEIFQQHGLEMDKYIIREIENGKRCVTDLELQMIANILKLSTDFLLS